MKEELISIIIPVYNAEKVIQETIQTIKKQTYKNWEAIFVDDVSKDMSYHIIEENKSDKIKLVKLKKHAGPAVARNKGISLAKGRYLCFLDADDLWDCMKLEKQIAFMEENTIGFSYTGFSFLKKQGKGKRKEVKVQKTVTYEEALKDIRILTITAMIDTDKIPKEVIYMPQIEAEDVATWWNILKQGHVAYAIQEPLAFYRRGQKTRGSNKLKSARNRWNLYRKIEKLSLGKSMYCFMYYAIYGILKRI